MSFNKKLYRSLTHLQTVCLKQSIPFVSYRLALQSEITTLVQYQSLPEKLETLQCLNEKTGFIVAPFIESENHSTYLLKPDNSFVSDNIDEEFIEMLKLNSTFSKEKSSASGIATTTFQDFVGQVKDAVKAMENHQFHKVVLSKIRVNTLDDDFLTSDFFLKLCDRYPHAMVYLIQLPGVGSWVGATPEPLLVIEDECVKTVSLAGTQIATGADVDSYDWSRKEIEEQGIVTNFVEQTLRSLDIKNYDKTGPANYQAANLIHLKTAFEFSQADLKDRLGDFLKVLHPTPSVGGLPKAEAREFILANEKHDRSYYTGFLGPVNINKNSYIFVNLRCLQLFDKQFALYSGAGITASSIAENEWEETDNKMMTMMNVMKTPNP